MSSTPKRKPSQKKPKLPPRVRLFSLRFHYITYLQEESYKYYLDFQDSILEEGDSQIVFSSHFFNTHVDKTKIDSSVLEVYQDNLSTILDHICNTIFKLCLSGRMDPLKVTKEFLATQTHIEEQDSHKIKGIYSFIEKRIVHLIEIHNRIAQSLKKGELTEEELAGILNSK